MKKNAGIVLAMILYAFLAVGIVFVIYIGGTYPVGADAMSHVYKGNVLYHNISQGNWYPLYDNLWYNGVQMLRYWAPLPVYFSAFCQFLAGGSDINGYLIYISLVFYGGALVWLYIGIRQQRIMLGTFVGVLWFFLPNNLYTLFVVGHLGRALLMVFLPLILYFIEISLVKGRWQTVCKIVPIYACMLLCDLEYAAVFALIMLSYLLIYRIINHQKGRCIPIMCAMLLGFALIGIWLVPSLRGGKLADDALRMMKEYFQDAVISLDPVRRLTRGNVDYYFGLSVFLLAVFGAVCGKKRSLHGFWAGLIIFACTTTSMCAIFAKIPGGRYIWMLQFISIALCFILYSFVTWDTLKRGFVVICCIILVVDIVPSYTLIYHGKGTLTASENMEQSAQGTLIAKTRKITKQRAALIDGSTLGAMAPYLLTDYNGAKVPESFGTGWRAATTSNNIARLNDAVEEGFYLFLFDRCLELGDDTVLIKKSELRDPDKDLIEVTECAQKLGYILAASNDSYLLYHIKTYEQFGTTCQYEGLAIGSSSDFLAYGYPNIEPGDSNNVNDYSYDKLSKYKVIYLSGFTYDDKDKAEKMLLRLSEAGVRIIVNGDGIPDNPQTKIKEFMGVECQDIYFQNGYPVLYTKEGELDTSLFDVDKRNWKTVYLNGLDNTMGYLYDTGVKIDFAGNVENDNIVFLGINLTYHYFLTRDESVGKFLGSLMDDALAELPDRALVPLDIAHAEDQIIIISPQDQVNTTIAYQDIFDSSEKIHSVHNLLEVNSGETKITLKYPYFWPGMIVSIFGVIGWILFGVWMRKRQILNKS